MAAILLSRRVLSFCFPPSFAIVFPLRRSIVAQIFTWCTGFAMALSGNICRLYEMRERERERKKKRKRVRDGTVGGYCGETGRGCASIEFFIWRRLLLSAMRTVKRESLHAGRLIVAGKPRRSRTLVPAPVACLCT